MPQAHHRSIAGTLTLLHGTARRHPGLALLGLALIPGSAAPQEPVSPAPGAEQAAGSQPASEAELPRLEEVLVLGRSDSLIGIADSATEGAVGRERLDRRPILRPGEIGETVPGLIITQHSGSGKANQLFLRGFNLDHGTDFATSLGGMPLNLPSHGHGQGYTDLNFIIPEIIETVRFRKGPYFADLGDFGSTGGLNIEYARSLEQTIARIEGGSFGYARGLGASSVKVKGGDLLFAVETLHDDGPWSHPDNFLKLNGVVRYSAGDLENGYTITGLAYHGDWDATDQIARRAVDQDLLSRFESLDETDGGNSERYGAIAELHRGDEDGRFKLQGYGYYYDLELFSNFTYFLDDPVNGDQFQQADKRYVFGASGSHDWLGTFWGGREVTTTLGAQVRLDDIDNGLFLTRARRRLSTVRSDEILETSFGPFFEHKTKWLEKLRTTVGVRGDLFNFDVDSDDSRNSDNVTDFIASPKAGIIFGPWAETEIYLNGGLGFHSNDARGVTSAVDPSTGAPVDKADPLVRTGGAEIGVRTLALAGLQSTMSLWFLDSDSELVFVGDAGTTEASRPSRRYGIEFANHYTPLEWLSCDADLAFSHAEFTDADPAGDHIPGSIEGVVTLGVSVENLHGFFGALRLRYFGPRPLVEDDSVRSAPTTLLSARVGYQLSKRWDVACDIFNLLDEEDNDVEYFYTSRLQGEPAGGVDDGHFHPVYPFTVHGALTGKF